jgi:pyrroline-5-carboxylate reductase
VKRLGFIGTGAITSAIVKGLAISGLRDWPISVSPRSRERADELASTIPAVSIATGNQAVVDSSDILILAIRPQIAAEVISDLRFRDGQIIVSLVAGMSVKTVETLVAVQIPVIRAIPLPSVETCSCATPITPHHHEIAILFDALGSSISVEDESRFDGYVAASAVMATYFGIVKTTADWMVASGVESADADRYLRSLFGNLGDIMREQPQLTFDQLRQNHTTCGGLNELVF